MPIKKQWLPPPEGIHFCSDFADVTGRGTFGFRSTYYTNSCSILERNRRMWLWKYCACAGHFGNFRTLMPYPRPPQRKRQRVPTPDDAPFLLCPHLEATDILITRGKNGIRIANSRDYLVFIFTGTYHMKEKSVRHWVFVACLDCYMMHRALIGQPMPLSHGFASPVGARINEVRWSNQSYGLFRPPWPPHGRRSVRWCRECQVPTAQIDKICMNPLHDENVQRLGRIERLYCNICGMNVEHSIGDCMRCKKNYVSSMYGISFRD